MNIEKKFPLGRRARFQIRFTTPLGEDFISVTGADQGGSRWPTARPCRNGQTDAAPGIEDTFAALSTLLNGGGLSQPEDDRHRTRRAPSRAAPATPATR